MSSRKLGSPHIQLIFFRTERAAQIRDIVSDNDNIPSIGIFRDKQRHLPGDHPGVILSRDTVDLDQIIMTVQDQFCKSDKLFRND